MAVSLLATVNAMSLIGPRVYYAMARNRAFFPIAARVHPKWRSPWIAVLAQGVCCCLLIVTGTFESLVYYAGFILAMFSALSVLALLKFRRREGWKPLAWVSFAYPLLPVVYVVVNLWIFFYFASGQPREAAWAAATILGGAFIYHLFIRGKSPTTP
jgi:APA family basic amino acid/polyamine antiporter